MNENENENFESVDMNESLTEEAIFNHLSDSFVLLDNLLMGAKTSKENLDKIYDLLNHIKSITTELKDSLISVQNINEISKNIQLLNETLKDWTKEEIKIISAMHALINETKELKQIIIKSNKKRIVESDNKQQEKQKSGGNIINTALLLILIGISSYGVIILKGFSN